MFCNNCGAQYDVLPIENGKSKFCRNCGNLLYKNENGTNIFSQLTVIPQHNELIKQQELEQERLKQEQIFKQRQLEIQQKQKEAELEQQRQFEIQRQKDLEVEKQRQLELEQQKQAELERKRQEELLKQRQLEIEKQKQAELEKQRQDEILKQQVAILEEKVRKEKEIEQLEFKKIAELNKQKEAEIERKRQEQIEVEIFKSSNALNALSESNIESKSVKTEEKKSNKAIYFFVPILLLAILSALGYFIFPDKIKAIFDPPPTSADTAIISTPTITTNTTDTALIDQLKADLIGKEVLSWNAIKPKEIKELTISSVSELDNSSNYIVTVQLDDNAGPKAITELKLSYNKIILENVATNKITYKNTAPTNAWFSFEPIANCDIFVNTNNNPIQLKTCDNCAIQKINTNAENSLQLATHPTTIFISSDTKYAAEIDFIYIPLK